jgi:hypothetical protein
MDQREYTFSAVICSIAIDSRSSTLSFQGLLIAVEIPVEKKKYRSCFFSGKNGSIFSSDMYGRWKLFLALRY